MEKQRRHRRIPTSVHAQDMNHEEEAHIWNNLPLTLGVQAEDFSDDEDSVLAQSNSNSILLPGKKSLEEAAIDITSNTVSSSSVYRDRLDSEDMELESGEEDSILLPAKKSLKDVEEAAIDITSNTLSSPSVYPDRLGSEDMELESGEEVELEDGEIMTAATITSNLLPIYTTDEMAPTTKDSPTTRSRSTSRARTRNNQKDQKTVQRAKNWKKKKKKDLRNYKPCRIVPTFAVQPHHMRESYHRSNHHHTVHPDTSPLLQLTQVGPPNDHPQDFRNHHNRQYQSEFPSSYNNNNSNLLVEQVSYHPD